MRAVGLPIVAAEVTLTQIGDHLSARSHWRHIENPSWARPLPAGVIVPQQGAAPGLTRVLSRSQSRTNRDTQCDMLDTAHTDVSDFAQCRCAGLLHFAPAALRDPKSQPGWYHRDVELQ